MTDEDMANHGDASVTTKPSELVGFSFLRPSPFSASASAPLVKSLGELLPSGLPARGSLGRRSSRLRGFGGETRYQRQYMLFMSLPCGLFAFMVFVLRDARSPNY